MQYVVDNGARLDAKTAEWTLLMMPADARNYGADAFAEIVRNGSLMESGIRDSRI